MQSCNANILAREPRGHQVHLADILCVQRLHIREDGHAREVPFQNPRGRGVVIAEGDRRRHLP